MAKIYGPWLRAEHSGTLFFINPEPEIDQRLRELASRKAEETAEKGTIFGKLEGYFSDMDKTTQTSNVNKKENTQLVQKEINKSIELKTLDLTLKRQE